MNQVPSLAASLEPHQRQKLALKVLSRQETISGIAEEEGVSRKFLYQQGDQAKKALKTAFEKPGKDNEVIYHLPVTQNGCFS